MKGTASEIKDSLKFISDESKVRVLSNFFKKHEGSYGHGDIFWGIKVPDNRAVAKGYIETPLSELEIMMDDEVHEVRLCAFLILVEKYSKSKKDPELSKGIVDFYLQNCHKANNWDMVDLSAPKILGEWLADPNKSSLSDREILFKLAKSSNLWEQRVSIVSTLPLIKKGDYDVTFTLSLLLIGHKHDLIRKAVGWMLREVGKVNREALNDFLEDNAAKMSRTTLSYAIEHYDKDRQIYYRGKKN